MKGSFNLQTGQVKNCCLNQGLCEVPWPHVHGVGPVASKEIVFVQYGGEDAELEPGDLSVRLWLAAHSLVEQAQKGFWFVSEHQLFPGVVEELCCQIHRTQWASSEAIPKSVLNSTQDTMYLLVVMYVGCVCVLYCVCVMYDGGDGMCVCVCYGGGGA